MSHSILDKIGFVRHKLLRVLLCKTCHKSKLVEEAPGHYKDNHSPIRYNNTFDLAEYADLCVKYKLVQSHAEVIHPAPRGPPVQFITITHNCYACTVDPSQCAYVASKLNTIEKHCKTHPDRNVYLPECYRKGVSAQTLFTHFGAKMFEVQKHLASGRTSSRSVLNIVLQDLLPKEPKVPLPITPDSDKERTRFLAFMDWDTHLHSYRIDKKRHTLLKDLRMASFPSAYSSLKPTLLEYIALGRDASSGGTSQSLTVRKHILHGRNIPSTE